MKIIALLPCSSVLLVGVVLVFVGCESGAIPVGDSTVDQVCTITAELLGVDRSQVNSETSLADLGADELDFVELIMELEDRFNITIGDDAAEKMMGTKNWRQGMANVTMSKLARIVEERRRP